MTNRQSLTVVATVVLVVVVGLAAVFWPGKDQTNSSSLLNNNSKNQNDAGLTNAADEMLLLETSIPVSPVITLVGGSLVNPSSKIVPGALHEALAMEVVERPGDMTSTQAVEVLLQEFREPPKVLVVDASRFDPAADISLSTTINNLRLIAAKGRELGIAVIVVTGLSGDGATTFGPTIRAALVNDVPVIDTTQLMLSSQYRSSVTELNAEGERQVADQLVAVVKNLNLQ